MASHTPCIQPGPRRVECTACAVCSTRSVHHAATSRPAQAQCRRQNKPHKLLRRRSKSHTLQRRRVNRQAEITAPAQSPKTPPHARWVSHANVSVRHRACSKPSPPGSRVRRNPGRAGLPYHCEQRNPGHSGMPALPPGQATRLCPSRQADELSRAPGHGIKSVSRPDPHRSAAGGSAPALSHGTG
jgi:hypothetical protein